MKNLLFIFLLSSSLFITADQGLEDISKAMKSGDANALAQHFDSDVEVTILDEVNIFSKSEAKAAVNTFFSSHKPKSYSQVHEGKSKGAGGQYIIGNLSTDAGKFRVYLYMRVENKKHFIQELRFEK